MTQYEKLIHEQREFVELIDRLEVAPPGIEEIILQERFPGAPRTRILRLIANKTLERTATA